MIPRIALLLLAAIPSLACADPAANPVQPASEQPTTIQFGSLALNGEVHTIEQVSLDRGILDDADLPCIVAVFAQKQAQLYLPLVGSEPNGEAILFYGGDMFISERITVREFEQGETLSISAKLDSGSTQLSLDATLNLRDCR